MKKPMPETRMMLAQSTLDDVIERITEVVEPQERLWSPRNASDRHPERTG